MTVSRLQPKPTIAKLRENQGSIYAVKSSSVEKCEIFNATDLVKSGKPQKIYHRSIESSMLQGQGSFKKMTPTHIASNIFYTIAPTPKGSDEQKVLIITNCYNTYLGMASKHVEGYSDSNKKRFLEHNGDLLATIKFVIERKQGKIKLEAFPNMIWLKEAIDRSEISTNINPAELPIQLRSSNL